MSQITKDKDGKVQIGHGTFSVKIEQDKDLSLIHIQMCIRDSYSGRENPPHPEIWINYFLRMMELYSKKVYELSKTSENDELRCV